MTTSRKSISKYSIALLAFLLISVLGLLLRHGSSGDDAHGAQQVLAADQQQELDDKLQPLPALHVRVPIKAVPADAGWIELADEETSALLEPEHLWIQPLDGSRSGLFEIAARELLTPERMTASRVLAYVPGYVPFSGRLTPRMRANVLLLKRAGSLEVRIVDAAGRPVEGCEVNLFLDQGDDEISLTERHSIFTGEHLETVHELIESPRGWVQSQEATGRSDWPKEFERKDWDSSVRRTSADGLAAWTDLPAHAGYRWYVAPPLHVQVEPTHERRRLEEVGDHVKTASPPPSGLSGRFDITTGQTLRLAGTLLASARVRGRVACPMATRAADVSLYSVDRAGGNTAPETTSFDEAKSQISGPMGEFEFAGLRPGVWAVRCWWEEEQHNYFFTCATFKLEAAADLDLGVLYPLKGESLEVAIGIVDQNGEPQAPELVYSSPSDRLSAHFAITAMPDNGIATQMVSGYFPVPFGEILRINGLQPGRVYASVKPSPGLALNVARVGSIVGAYPEGFDVGSTDFLYLELTARMGTARPLVLRNERGEEVTPPAVWVRELGSNRLSSVRPRRIDSTAPERGQVLNLPNGSYELLCKFSTKNSPQGFAARATAIFDDSSQRPIELNARPAVSVSGVLRDSSGAGIPNQSLVWGLEGWALDPDNPIFGATTDEQGTFVLNEIPAHTALRSSRAGCDLPPLAPGRHEGLILTTTP